MLIDPSPVNDYPHFTSEIVNVPGRFKSKISRVLLLKRLREVTALLGFTRVEAPDDSADLATGPTKAPLSRGKPDWVPADQVHGEGIFINSMSRLSLSGSNLKTSKALMSAYVAVIRAETLGI